MLKQFALLVRCRDDVRVTMPDAHGHNSTKPIEITPAFLVPDVLHFSLYQHERLFVVEENSRIQKLFALRQHFSGRRAGIFLRLMSERRQYWSLHLNLFLHFYRAMFVGRRRMFNEECFTSLYLDNF